MLSRENHDAGLPLGLIYCMNKNMVRDRVTALRETTMFEPRALRHFISGVRVTEVDGDRIVAQANFAVMESLSDREPTLNMVGRYLDELRVTPQAGVQPPRLRLRQLPRAHLAHRPHLNPPQGNPS